jgi:hypothetical protein
MRAASEARHARLEAARAKERKARTSAGTAFRINGKRAKVTSESEGGSSSGIDTGDDQFLPEDKAGAENEDDGVFLSKEVRDLMAK